MLFFKVAYRNSSAIATRSIETLRGLLSSPHDGPFSEGEYVFATKFSDSSPMDPWYVGFVSSIHEDDINMHGSGLYRYHYAVKITAEEGDLILNSWGSESAVKRYLEKHPGDYGNFIRPGSEPASHGV